jgi:plasmid maintenance system antidote protein VapI
MPIVAVPNIAVPPARLLREEIEYRGLTVEQLAGLMGWAVADADALVAGRANMTQAAADALARALGTDAGLWMHLETAYQGDLERLNAFTRERKG